jgi:hypothetical protein
VAVAGCIFPDPFGLSRCHRQFWFEALKADLRRQRARTVVAECMFMLGLRPLIEASPDRLEIDLQQEVVDLLASPAPILFSQCTAALPGTPRWDTAGPFGCGPHDPRDSPLFSCSQPIGDLTATFPLPPTQLKANTTRCGCVAHPAFLSSRCTWPGRMVYGAVMAEER